MMQPGFKVMHVQDLDFRSVCQPFKACLARCAGGRMRIRATFRFSFWWKLSRNQSTARCILRKQSRSRRKPSTSWTMRSFSVSAEEMITPDDVRGIYDTLNEAVLAGNWPR